MKRNNHGVVTVVAVLAIALVGLVLLFVPNPVSSVAGIGVKPNTVVQKQSHTEQIVPLLDAQGHQVAFKEVSTDTIDNSDKAPKGWINDLLALPRLWILLMVLGCFFPVLGGAMGVFNAKVKAVAKAAYDDLTGEAKCIVVSVKAGIETIADPIAKQKFLDALSKYQDSSTKDLVKELLKA